MPKPTKKKSAKPKAAKAKGRVKLKNIGSGRNMYPIGRGNMGKGGPHYITKEVIREVPAQQQELQLPAQFYNFMRDAEAQGRGITGAARTWGPLLVPLASAFGSRMPETFAYHTEAGQQQQQTGRDKAQADEAPRQEQAKTKKHAAQEEGETERLAKELSEKKRRKHIETGIEVEDTIKTAQEMFGAVKGTFIDPVTGKIEEIKNAPKLRGNEQMDIGFNMTRREMEEALGNYTAETQPPYDMENLHRHQIDPAKLERYGRLYEAGSTMYNRYAIPFAGAFGVGYMAANRR
jgi:molecular chaperone GrpE (heat shock protein)